MISSGDTFRAKLKENLCFEQITFLYEADERDDDAGAISTFSPMI